MSYQAIYFDGVTARRQEVIIRLKSRKLVILNQKKREIAAWPLRKVVRVEPIGKHMPLRLRCRKASNARLVLHDDAAILAMIEKIPRLFKENHSNRGLFRGALILALFTSTIVITLFFTIPKLAKPIAQSVPANWEEQIGQATFSSVTKRWPVCQGDGTQALLFLSERLERVTNSRSPVKISVVRAKALNAFAIPGGRILVTDSLINFMRGPDELAGVLAHEIGHLVLRHPLEGVLSQLGVALVLNAISGGGSSELVNIGTMIASISYTRDYEREADRLGLKILNGSDVSTKGYAQLFERMTQMEGEDFSDSGLLDLNNLLRSHPFANERAQLALQYPSSQNSVAALTAPQWESVRALCQAEREKEGVANGRVDRQ